MVAAKRATAGITDDELRAVAELTYRDAAAAIGVSSATVRDLYRKRGVPRANRKRGEMANYHTRAQYKTGDERNRRETVNDNPLGLKSDGGRVAIFWDTMSEDMAGQMGLAQACRDLGTEICLACELGEQRCLDDCDFKCGSCEYETVCPCSLWNYMRRQHEISD